MGVKWLGSKDLGIKCNVPRKSRRCRRSKARSTRRTIQFKGPRPCIIAILVVEFQVLGHLDTFWYGIMLSSFDNKIELGRFSLPHNFFPETFQSNIMIYYLQSKAKKLDGKFSVKHWLEIFNQTIIENCYIDV